MLNRRTFGKLLLGAAAMVGLQKPVIEPSRSVVDAFENGGYITLHDIVIYDDGAYRIVHLGNADGFLLHPAYPQGSSS